LLASFHALLRFQIAPLNQCLIPTVTFGMALFAVRKQVRFGVRHVAAQFARCKSALKRKPALGSGDFAYFYYYLNQTMNGQ
jgi:hypothetical protein